MVRRALIIVVMMAVWPGTSSGSSAPTGSLEVRPVSNDPAQPIRLVGKHARQQLAVTLKLTPSRSATSRAT